jgi:predicted lipoprotein with Yx(FWY)xxD motif
VSGREHIGMAATAAAVVLAAAALVLAIVERGHASRPRRRPAAAADAPVLGVRRTRLGPIVVDARGHTLYAFTKDRRDRSACTGGCTRVWPPALVPARPEGGVGIRQSRIGTLRRRDGGVQLVYAGHPLYALTADTRPGQMNGQGFEGAWFVVSPGGRPVGAARAKGGAGY